MMHPPPMPPRPCADLAHWRLGRHWHHPAWAELAHFDDLPALLMLLRWWPTSRRLRRGA